MFAAMMIRFNLGRTFCAGLECVCGGGGGRWGERSEETNTLRRFRSAIVFKGTRCMPAPRQMHINTGSRGSLLQMDLYELSECVQY